MLFRVALHLALISNFLALVPSSVRAASLPAVGDVKDIYMRDVADVMIAGSHEQWSVFEGTNVRLHCELVSPDDSFEWYYQVHVGNSGYSDYVDEFVRSNLTIINEGNKTLFLSPVEQTQGGIYQCMESRTRRTSVLTGLEVLPHYTVPDVELRLVPRRKIDRENIKEGDDIQFECKFETLMPEDVQKIEWYLDGNRIFNNPRYGVGISKILRTLTLRKVSQEQEGDYECSLRIPRYGPYAHVEEVVKASSNIFNLRLKYVREIDMNEDYSDSGQLQRWDIYEGTHVLLHCRLVSPDDSFEWLYQADNADQFERFNATVINKGNKTLFLSPVTRTQSGVYQCMESRTRRLSFLTALNVQYADVEIQLGRPLERHNIKEGDDVYFECLLQTSVPFIADKVQFIEWYLNGNNITQNLSMGVILNNRTLVLQKVSQAQEGEYECSLGIPRYGPSGNIERVVKSSSNIFNLRLKFPQVQIIPPGDRFVKEGSVVLIECQILNAVHQPQFIFWYHEGIMVLDQENSNIQISVNQTGEESTISTMTIYRAGRGDSGNYTCMPSNLHPASFSLYVLDGERRSTIDAPPTEGTTTVTTPIEQRTDCEHPFERVGQGCLLVASILRLGWDTSRQFCHEAFNADLMIFRDAKELLEITQYLSDKKYDDTHKEHPFWLGATHDKSNAYIHLVDNTHIEPNSLLMKIFGSQSIVKSNSTDSWQCYNMYYSEPGSLQAAQCGNDMIRFMPVCQYFLQN